MPYRFLLVVAFSLSSLASVAQRAPKAIPRLAPSFFTTYTYLTYTILDKGTSPEPMAASGVGGTLTLRPNGTYQKRLVLAGNGGSIRFDQDGRYTFAGNRISFSYTTKQGQARTDQGTFRLRNGLLTLTLEGYPAGNQSTYTLKANE
ncbi:hypothetical protein [Hymenobacter weizhouensis]|uniref:hypothetical protein n=1 Tax=Hymenobacter sp. YIM 151500-1 TaxID=2987689 RepID=UPI00222766D8|nr:hypothetical protein [Hymenobacter sp. YIM 151500-1]UYZ64692.1 hypothetical protein OIS53_07540 [Hymenobacter sp. YIM 151500-1]